MYRIRIFAQVALVILGLSLAAACSSSVPSSDISPEAEESEPQLELSPTSTQPKPTPTLIVPTDTPETFQFEPIDDEPPLSETGPWVVYPAHIGVFVSNSDGRGMTLLHPFQVVEPYVAGSRIWAAPQGGRVAVLELINMEGTSMLFPNLKVIKVPSGEVELDLALVPENWEEVEFVVDSSMSGRQGYETPDGEAVEQIFAATGRWNKLAWSHDGSMLAFNAAIDGPSTDLYVYHTSDRSVVRLTDGSSQSVDPVFSPDDQYIIHGAVATLNWGFSGGGYDYLNIWAARSDDGGVNKVYDKEFYGYEHVLGWRSASEYIAASSEVWCEFSDIRIVDIHSGVIDTLFSGIHNENEFAPERDRLLFYLDDYIGGGECERSIDTGVYLLDTNTKKLIQVEEIDPNQITGIIWNPQADTFFVSSQRDVFYAVDSSGTVIEYPAPPELNYQPPLVSPDGERWLFYDEDNDMVAFGDNDGRYTEYKVDVPQAPIWTSDSTLALFFGELDGDKALFGSAIPGPRPIVIDPDVWTPLGRGNVVFVKP